MGRLPLDCDPGFLEVVGHLRGLIAEVTQEGLMKEVVFETALKDKQDVTQVPEAQNKDK